METKIYMKLIVLMFKIVPDLKRERKNDAFHVKKMSYALHNVGTSLASVPTYFICTK